MASYHRRLGVQLSRWATALHKTIPSSSSRPMTTLTPPPPTVRALIFPGQGAQTPGMIKDVYDASPAARAVFEEAEEALDMDLCRIIFRGSQSELVKTEVAQPAILVASIATLRALEAERGIRLSELGIVALGHSLGEYTALVATGALTFPEAVRLVRLRGLAMSQSVAGLTYPTAMSALMVRKDKLAQLEEYVKTQPPPSSPESLAELANFNSSFQVVLSGGSAGVDSMSKAVQAKGLAARAVDLPVSAPFHCSLMKPAAEILAPHLRKASWCAPILPVISNVTALPVTNPGDIPDLLYRQVTSPVRWYESVTYCTDVLGVNEWIAIGPGRVLSNLAKKEFPRSRVKPVGSWKEIEEFYWKGPRCFRT